jgi:hypothetical protein
MTAADTLTYPTCASLPPVAVQNVPQATCPGLEQTPSFAFAYGDVVVRGRGAEPGSLIQALDDKGNVVGCGEVRQSGLYGMIPIYGVPDGETTEGLPIFTLPRTLRWTLNDQELLMQQPLPELAAREVVEIDLTDGWKARYLPLVVK